MNDKLTIQELGAYLPWGVECQYEGITNGKDISKHQKDFEKENTPYPNWQFYEPIEEQKGLKIAPLKTIRVYKKHFVATCGIYTRGQKAFYNGIGLKLVLLPLSHLTKEIEHKGEKFVPSHFLRLNYSLGMYQFNEDKIYSSNYGKFINATDLPFTVVQKLLEFHIDIFNLIPRGLAIDKTTIQ